jgi:hypothetical protein
VIHNLYYVGHLFLLVYYKALVKGFITPGVGTFMWRQLFRWGTITGLFLAGSAEGACTEKWFAKIW